MAAPTTTNEVTTRRLSAVISGLWNKIKTLLAGKSDITEGVYYVVGTHDYPAWVANHAYAVNDTVNYGNQIKVCKTAHTSGSTYDSSKWNNLGTPVLKGTIDGVTTLYTGLKIAYRWPCYGGASSTYLNINGLGNVYVRRNNGNLTTHLPIGSVSFLAYDGTYWQWADYDSNTNNWVTSMGAYCDTAAATAAKVAISTSHVYTAGETFLIRFTVANTAASKLTLNINSQGAKDIWINGAVSSASNYTIPAGEHWCHYDGSVFRIWTDGTVQFSKLKLTNKLSDDNIASAATWNAKQDALSTQTAYSAKGTATKVPQITTNSLGQVTGITEVTISGVTPASHSHGNIANGGTLTDTAAAAAGNDYVVIRDADNAKIQTSTIKGTDVADAVSKKHSHSTLTLSTTAQAYDGTHTLALPSTDPYTSARTPASHTHGNIQNGGTLQTTDVTIASGDKLVVTDASDSNKVARTSTAFDGSTTNMFLSKKGVFGGILEADVNWGGSFRTTLSPTEVALIPMNIIHNPPPAAVTFEKTVDGGTTWTSVTISDANKLGLCNLSSGGSGFSIANSEYSGVSDITLIKGRITVYALNDPSVTTAADTWYYGRVQRLLMFISKSGDARAKIEYRRWNDHVAQNTTWGDLGTYNVAGDSGWNSIPINDVPFGGYSSQLPAENRNIAIRITFWIASGSSPRITIYRIGMPFSISWTNRANTLNNNGLPITVNSDGTGTVQYASVLATSRKLAVNLANTSTDSSFNGSADQTGIKVSGTLPVANGGTGKTSLSDVRVGSADKPAGFSSMSTSVTWGTLKPTNEYTAVTHWDTASGGSVAFADKSGQTSMQIDGVFYQREGNYAVLDTSSTIDASKVSGTVGAATKATQDSDGNAINATYFKSSGNVTLVSNTATKIGTQNGTDVKLTLPAIPAAVSVKGNAESSYRTGQVNLTPANLGISATTSSVTVGSTTFNNTDTKVKATAKTDNVNYKILATASASPTSGSATEAVYDTDITLNPSTNTIAANISGNAAAATTADSVSTAIGSGEIKLLGVANNVAGNYQPKMHPTIRTFYNNDINGNILMIGPERGTRGAADRGGIRLSGGTGYYTQLQTADFTADRWHKLPDESGNLAITSGTYPNMSVGTATTATSASKSVYYASANLGDYTRYLRIGNLSSSGGGQRDCVFLATTPNGIGDNIPTTYIVTASNRNGVHLVRYTRITPEKGISANLASFGYVAKSDGSIDIMMYRPAYSGGTNITMIREGELVSNFDENADGTNYVAGVRYETVMVSQQVGSTDKPVYVDSNGVVQECAIRPDDDVKLIPYGDGTYSSVKALYNAGKKLYLVTGGSIQPSGRFEYRIPLTSITYDANLEVNAFYFEQPQDDRAGASEVGSIAVYRLDPVGWTTTAKQVGYAVNAGAAVTYTSGGGIDTALQGKMATNGSNATNVAGGNIIRNLNDWTNPGDAEMIAAASSSGQGKYTLVKLWDNYFKNKVNQIIPNVGYMGASAMTAMQKNGTDTMPGNVCKICLDPNTYYSFGYNGFTCLGHYNPTGSGQKYYGWCGNFAQNGGIVEIDFDYTATVEIARGSITSLPTSMDVSFAAMTANNTFRYGFALDASTIFAAAQETMRFEVSGTSAKQIKGHARLIGRGAAASTQTGTRIFVGAVQITSPDHFLVLNVNNIRIKVTSGQIYDVTYM